MSSGPVKIVSVIRRRPDLTFEQFVDHWQQRHPRPTWPWDGMAQLWFDDMRAIKLAFESPEADRMRDDEKNSSATRSGSSPPIIRSLTELD
jgi:hypothetical protein